MLNVSVSEITRPKDIQISSDEVIDAIRHKSGPLAQLKLDYEPQIKTLWVTLAPEPKPVFTLGLVDSLFRLQKAVIALWGKESYARSPIRFFVYRSKGPIFTLGGDLDFYLDCIAKGDRAGLLEHARLSVEDVIGNASSLSGAAITMVTIEGKSIGGGVDAQVSCNIAIAEEHTSFSYPEVKFNHFPVSASAVLSRRVGNRIALKLLSNGTESTATEFEALGALDAVTASGEGEAWIRKYASETLPIHAARLGLFEAFYRPQAEAFRNELGYLAAAWTDHMLRLSPMEISRLQRISATQDRMLQRLYSQTKGSEMRTKSLEPGLV
ncbi:MAG: enoyl-CoA hydratase-related protein [Methylovirgula sp.]|uniref:enoyl-CoA hydratase-related protein n=1 Tax=Methylovirgula sp. TaxID=1978224 RepID=UPI0030762D3D